MKSLTWKITALLSLCALASAPALHADPRNADDTEGRAPAAESPASELALQPKQNYWGVDLGYVFNKIPISMSTFDVFLSKLWYSHVFGDASDNTRVAGTVGLYGFELLLPVPEASVDFYLGKPSQDLQFKAGVGGFYDVSVGGHGGLTGDIGVVLKNRVDISFLAVPVGTDSKRSYSEFLGLKTKEEAQQDYADAGGHYVELPYYGIMVGLRF